MLYPKKVKYRKWQKNRQNPKFLAPETRGTDLSFGSFGLKAVTYNHITSNQIESARKVIARSVGRLDEYGFEYSQIDLGHKKLPKYRWVRVKVIHRDSV